MFTAVVVTRFLMKNVINLGIKNKAMFAKVPAVGGGSEMTVKNHSKICLIFTVSASIMVVALILSLCGLGVNYGLDFTGGLSMQYDMGSAFDEADIRNGL